MSILYNNVPLKLVNNNKLVVNYLDSDVIDGTWHPEWEGYIKTHKAEIITYYQAQEVIFQHGLKEYLRKHRAVLRPNSEKNKLGKKAGEK